MPFKVPYTAFPQRIGPLKSELMASIETVLDSGMYVLGENVREFEREFANYCGTEYSVGVANGTCSLHLALRALGIGPGDEVITASNSFIASAGAIGVTGAKPVFADIAEDLNIDPSKIEEAITENTRAIMPVHLTGRSARMDQIMDIARRHKLAVIEDAAQAVGARWGNRTVGGFGDAACFSLHPLKNLHAFGDGGMFVTNSESIFKDILKLRNHGLESRDQCDFWGYNCRLDEIQAAVLRLFLARLDKWTERRRELAFRYNRLLSPYVTVPLEGDQEYHVYQTYVIQADRRDGLQAHLREKGVEALVHYPVPIHCQPAAHYLGYDTEDLPVTHLMAGRILSLPLYPEMEERKQDYVVEQVACFYEG